VTTVDNELLEDVYFRPTLASRPVTTPRDLLKVRRLGDVGQNTEENTE
jgi:hypothetical protein